MRQSIEKKRETKPFRTAVTAIFDGGQWLFGGLSCVWGACFDSTRAPVLLGINLACFRPIAIAFRAATGADAAGDRASRIAAIIRRKYTEFLRRGALLPLCLAPVWGSPEQLRRNRRALPNHHIDRAAPLQSGVNKEYLSWQKT